MDPFVHLSEYFLIVCQICEYCCVADEVATHLRVRHSDLSASRRRAVQQIIQDTPGVIRSQVDLSRVELPTSSTAPIPFLASPKVDGLKCRKCYCTKEPWFLNVFW